MNTTISGLQHPKYGKNILEGEKSFRLKGNPLSELTSFLVTYNLQLTKNIFLPLFTIMEKIVIKVCNKIGVET